MEYVHGNCLTGIARQFRDGVELATLVVGSEKDNDSLVRLLVTKQEYDDRLWKWKPCWEENWETIVARLPPKEIYYIPAAPGDKIVARYPSNGRPFEHTVRVEDFLRGYVVVCGYEGVRAGWLDQPIFIRPRLAYEMGAADRPSISVIDVLTELPHPLPPYFPV
jgi:hypothetical protein